MYNFYYPVILLLDDELALIKDSHALSEHTDALPDFLTRQAVILNHQCKAINIEGTPQKGYELKELEHILARQLSREGHCCTAKLNLTEPGELFALLAQLQD